MQGFMKETVLTTWSLSAAAEVLCDGVLVMYICITLKWIKDFNFIVIRNLLNYIWTRLGWRYITNNYSSKNT